MIVFESTQAAEATGPTQIAFSDKLGAEVFANPDGSGEWCRETVSLSLLLKDDSPLFSSGLSAFVARIGAAMAAKCPDAKSARVAVYRDSDRKLVAGPYTISDANNWVSPQNLGQSDEPPPDGKSDPGDLQAAQRAAKLAAQSQQRERNIASLSRLPADVRLANFLSADPGVDPNARLDNLAVVRGRALASRQPVTVRMLVQAGSGGNDHVDTSWPGHLRLTVPRASPALERGSWYLVEGALSLDGPAEELKPAELSARTVFACKQDLCADAQDPGAIVDHKLAAAGGL